MNDHLKSAYERDKRNKNYLISPISKLDAEIIQEITIALKKLQSDSADELKSIIEEWKFLKDEEIRDLLLGWNIKHPEGEKVVDRKYKTEFIAFMDSAIEVSLVKTLHVDDNYNYNKNEMEYRIIINKGFPENLIISDMVFVFKTYGEREKRLESLKKDLSKFIKIL